MQNPFEQFGAFAKQSSEATMASAGAMTRGLQAVAAEFTSYAKLSAEQGTSTVQKLSGARTLDRAMEIQGEYARSACEGFMAQATKVGEIAQTTAREVFAPLGALAQRAVPTV